MINNWKSAQVSFGIYSEENSYSQLQWLTFTGCGTNLFLTELCNSGEVYGATDSVL